MKKLLSCFVLSAVVTLCCKESSAVSCTTQSQACVQSSDGCFAANKNTLECTTGCNGVTSSKLTVQSLTAQQNGVPVDNNGGVDLSKPLIVTASILNNYGVVASPSVDVDVFYCTSVSSNCSWKKQSTYGMTSNLDPCKGSSILSIDDCHLNKTTGSDVQVSLTIDLSKRPLIHDMLRNYLHAGSDYQFEVTWKDGATPTLCLTAQYMLLKV